LTASHGKHIAVIQNEFGEEIGIEEAFVGSQDQLKQWIELPNGCICCTVKDDLLMTVEKLVKMKNEQGKRLDYIFVECSGLAEPGPIASVFWVDEQLESEVHLDGIVTLVDSMHILKHLNEQKSSDVVNEAEKQISFADRIILNKKDLVNEQQLKEIVKRIQEVNSIAPISITERAKVQLEDFLNIGAFDPKRITEFELQIGKDLHHQHKHDSTVTTESITEEGDVSLDDLTHWLGTILWEEGSTSIFRCKGVISVAEKEQKYMLQGVHTLFQVDPTSASWGTDKRINKLVFVGRGIDQTQLAQSFHEICILKR